MLLEHSVADNVFFKKLGSTAQSRDKLVYVNDIVVKNDLSSANCVNGRMYVYKLLFKYDLNTANKSNSLVDINDIVGKYPRCSALGFYQRNQTVVIYRTVYYKSGNNVITDKNSKAIKVNSIVVYQLFSIGKRCKTVKIDRVIVDQG